MITLPHYLFLASLLFCIGLVGMLIRKNVLTILLSLELMLNAANLSFVSFSSFGGDLTGQAVVFFTMIVAAAEVAVALSIVLVLYRKRASIGIEEARSLKW